MYNRRKISSPADNVKISKVEMEKAMLETDKKVLKQWAASKFKKQRYKAARNPNTPMATLKRLQGYPEENPYIIEAAKMNPQMFETEDGDIWARAESRVKKSRMKAAVNPNAPIGVINLLLNDTDTEVAMTAARNPNIDDSSMARIDDIGGINTKIYGAFLDNINFKKEWINQWLDIMQDANLDTLKYLEDNRFFDNETEWLELYELAVTKMPGYLSSSKIATFWYNFFVYPKENYSEKIVLQVLSDWSKELLEHSPGTFGSIHNTPMDTPSVSAAMFEITGNEEFLPEDAQEMFLF